MTKTRIDITAKDETKGAFSSVDRSLSTLSGSVSKLTGLVGALGVGFSAVGAAASIKGVIDANDALAKMSAATGIAVESLAGLEFAASQSGTNLDQVSKGVRRFSRLILESADGTDKYGRLIRALGLDLDELKNSTPEEQFIKLSGAIRDNVSEQERAVVVTSLFGNEYAKLTPLLSQGEQGLRDLIARGKELNPVTAESAKKSEEFNDRLDELSRSFDAIKVEAASSILPTLNSIAGEMAEATKESGILVGALTGVGSAFKKFFESDFFLSVVGATGPLGTLLKSRVEANKLAEELKNTEDQADETADSLQDVKIPSANTGTSGDIGRALKRINEESKGASKSVREVSRALNDEQKEAIETENEIRALTLAYDPLIKRNEELARLINLLNAGLSRNVFDAAAKDAIEQYTKATEGVNKATKDVKQSTDALGQTGQQVFESMSEFAIQGARNIQTSLSDALIEGIKGFDNFADSVLDIIKRLAANIASVRLLEGLGIGGLLGVGSSGAFAGSTNAAGGFTNAFGGSGGFSLSGLGSSAFDLVNSGFGASNLFNSFATSGIGQNLGLSVTGPVADFGQLTSLGSSIGTGLATVGAGAIGVGIGSALAGNKQVFGVGGTATSAIGAGIGAAVGGPIGAALGGVLGGGISALFGRGPLKQKDSLIRGTITDEGIGGDFLTATNFRAKGGVLRGDKVDRVIINANTGELVNGAPGLPESGISSSLLPFADQASEQALQIGQIFDQAIQGFDASLRQAGDTLGIGSDQLNNFQRWIQLTADSAEGITETQVAEEIQNIGDHMANVLLPGLQDMRKEGETATQALNRIVAEFTSLEDALIVFGVSAQDANAAISALSVATRTELVDAAGGVEALNSQITFFANNFLSAEEQLEIGFAKLDADMQALGLSANMTVEEFKNLILSVTQAGGASVELVSALLQLAPAFLNVKNAQEQLAAQSQTLGAQSQTAAPSVDNLTGSVTNLSGAAAGAANTVNNSAAAIQASFNRIDAARANLASAERELTTANAQSVLSDAQAQLSEANSRLSTARSNLSAAQSAAQRVQQQRDTSDQRDFDNQVSDIISQRSKLISAYQEEASALKSVVDRFGALSVKILDFKDSLAVSNLSPFSPGEQLAIARQQFNETRNLAAQGDEKALDKLPEVSRTFLEASKEFNGATAAFESDFNFVQQVLESSGATARATRDIANEQLAGIEGTITQLQALNEAAQNASRISAAGFDSANSINSAGFDNVTGSVMSVEDALAEVERATNDVAAAQANVDDATAAVNEAVRANGGAITDVERATNNVESAVLELAAAVLQGFGNAAISDQVIRDFVIANQQLTDQQFAQIAVQNGISGLQLGRALAPLGVSQERINVATGGLSVRGSAISDFVDANINNPMAIYQAAIANGISSQRLAAESRLSEEEINNFVRANGLRQFERGTDFVTKTGPAIIHKGEGITPSSVPGEIKKLREELAQLRREQNQQMSALINTNIQANRENAQAIAKSNERLANNANWQQRSRPKVA